MAHETAGTDLAQLDSFALLKQADGGNKRAQVLLGQRCDEEAKGFPLADVVRTVDRVHLDSMKQPDGTKLAIRNTMRTMRKDILGKNPTPLEKLLVDRIITWLSGRPGQGNAARKPLQLHGRAKCSRGRTSDSSPLLRRCLCFGSWACLCCR